jgi:hypothetical protein
MPKIVAGIIVVVISVAAAVGGSGGRDVFAVIAIFV